MTLSNTVLENSTIVYAEVEFVKNGLRYIMPFGTKAPNKFQDIIGETNQEREQYCLQLAQAKHDSI